jgi:hypothetical protein
MVNYQKTEACYKNENYTYPKSIEQKGYEMWLQKITNPNTGTSYRISDLPIEWRKNKEDKLYPLKHANQNNQNKNSRWKRVAQVKATMDCNRWPGL